MQRAPRIAVYTHDTFGLGHVRRCLHVLRSLARAAPDTALLLVTGSPALAALGPLPPNADCVKIPTIAKTGRPGARPPHLDLPPREITRMRRRIAREAVLGFAPDVLLVDNFPLGSRRELLPLLEELSKRPTRVVLGLRDIVDLPENVRAHWARDRIHPVLERCYDRILVYGVPEILEVGPAYALSASVREKVRYCGYVTSVAPPAPASTQAFEALPRPRLLATVGGGGDGVPLLRAFLRSLSHRPEASALVVTGPLMSAAERAEIEALAADRPRVLVRESVRELPAHMAVADLVVSMAGYNTVAELLALARRAVLVPRTWRYGQHAQGDRAVADGEQLLRAQALEKAGLADVIHPAALDPEALAERIGAALRRPRPLRAAEFELDGLDRVTRELLALVDAGDPERADASD